MKTPREILFSRHRNVEPELDRMWARITARPAVAPYRLPPTLWRELFWPCRRIWTGLACAWVLIIAAHIASSEPVTREAGKTATPSRDEMQALVEQRRMLAQLIGPLPDAAVHRRTAVPGPRSEATGRVEAV
jgi:hypothetical protein